MAGVLLKDLKWSEWCGATMRYREAYVYGRSSLMVTEWDWTGALLLTREDISERFFTIEKVSHGVKPWRTILKNADALTAQCVLWELTSGGNDAP